MAPGPERRILNRELNLIEFFRHVLDEARDQGNPLLERLRFLTIFSGILDEFFMVRVSGLKEEVEHGYEKPSLDGLTASEQLCEIRNRLAPMVHEQLRCLQEEILPELEHQGVVVAPYNSLSRDERKQVDEASQESDSASRFIGIGRSGSIRCSTWHCAEDSCNSAARAGS